MFILACLSSMHKGGKGAEKNASKNKSASYIALSVLTLDKSLT